MMSIFSHPIGVRLIVGTFGMINVSIVFFFWTGLPPEKDSNEKPSERGVAHTNSGATTFIIDNRSMPKVSTTHNPDGSGSSDEYFVQYPASDRKDDGYVPRERMLPPPPMRY